MMNFIVAISAAVLLGFGAVFVTASNNGSAALPRVVLLQGEGGGNEQAGCNCNAKTPSISDTIVSSTCNFPGNPSEPCITGALSLLGSSKAGYCHSTACPEVDGPCEFMDVKVFVRAAACSGQCLSGVPGMTAFEVTYTNPAGGADSHGLLEPGKTFHHIGTSGELVYSGPDLNCSTNGFKMIEVSSGATVWKGTVAFSCEGCGT